VERLDLKKLTTGKSKNSIFWTS